MGHCRVAAVIVRRKNEVRGKAVTVTAKDRRCLFSVIRSVLPMLPSIPRLLQDDYILSS